MKNWGPVAAIVFAGILAYVVGVRLGESAMAVVIGVVFGVAASVPTSIVLALILRRADADRASPPPPDYHQPTIIVAPPGAQGGPGQAWFPGPSGGIYLPPLEEEGGQSPRNRRRYRIVGED